jgi:hypothetical protein
MSDSDVKNPEQWIEAIGWPEYEVSSFGNVRRIVKKKSGTYVRPVTPWMTKKGYMVVALSRAPIKKYFLVHRLIYESFHGPQNNLDVCHNDGKKTNNNLQNLRSDTRAGNMADTVKHGTHIRGERCGTNKYTTEKIRAFKLDLKSGVKVAQACKKHEILFSTGYGISKNVTWKWLDV